jgi:TolA-binding protein
VVTAPATTVTKNVDASKSAADHAKDIGGGDSLASERGRSFDLPAMPAKPPPPPPAQAQTLTFREADKKVSPADEKPSRREALPENKADAPQHHEHASKKSDPYLFGGDAKRSSVGQAADPNATLDTGAMGGELANDNKPAEAAGPNSLAQKAEGGRLARDDENPKDLDNLQGSFKKQIVKEAAKGKKKAYRPNSNDKGDQSPAKGSSGEGHAVALNGDLHDTSDATRGAGMPSAGTAGLLPTSNTQSESNKTASTTPKTSAPMATPTTPAVAAAPTPPPAPEPTMREEEGLESAERSAEKAAERERKQAQSELRDGYLAQRDNRHEQAAKHFLSFAEQNPDDARAQDALFQAAAEKAKQGNTEEAVQLYLRFANTYSSEKRAPTALFEAARLLYLRGETARAIQIQSQLEKQFPSSPEISRLTQMRSVSGPAHPAPAKRSKASSAYGATDDEYQAPAPASAPASAPAAADSLQQLSK